MENDQEKPTVSSPTCTALLCCCEHCNNGDGDCVFPYYGLAPHKHNTEKTGGSVIGSTEILKEEYPENFAEDSECEGLGTHTHCLHCNRPNSEELHFKDMDTREARKAT
ncbi:hypothetical protein [Pseudoalteromonas sp. S554]|uniref:hypothetical protein n=1 Tax=Pseudoalteromonas sp. S554 TaxID=2066516 RepID=UPI00110CE549|nr:hypothetical protein [Pseudoalteromonas sp. S554]TMS80575.1 hypothetical protein CWB65_14510 [Pseudoalteromonas sp. S554]